MAPMDAADNTPSRPSYEELVRQNADLRSELAAAQSGQDYLWSLLVETTRRLQVSSASIKAAVSSLLNYDLFWDPANQHEFLETIDASVDKVARAVILLALAFRAEAGSLEIRLEPQSLQEILALVHANAASANPKRMHRLSLPGEGKPVLVDYEYLTIAFGYLFDLLAARQESGKIRIEAVETPDYWSLEITGVDEADLSLLQTMTACKTAPLALTRYALLPELVLGLHVACEIFHLQNIEIEAISAHQAELVLRLKVPTFNNKPMES